MPAFAIGVEEREQIGRTVASSFTDSAEHLLAELELLRLRLQREVLRLRASGFLTDDRFRGLYVSDDQVDSILDACGAPRAGLGERNGDASPMADLNGRIQAAGEEIEGRIRSSLAQGVSLPLIELANTFSLSNFESDVLVVCVATELDLQFETLYSYAQNDVTRKRPTPDLVLRLLCDSFVERFDCRAIFAHGSKLLGPPLIRFTEDAQNREPALLARPLKLEERIVSFLLGQPAIDRRLAKFTVRLVPRDRLSDLELPSALSSELAGAARAYARGGGILFFCGPKGAGKTATAAALAAAAGRSLLVADLREMRAGDLPLPVALALLQREALLEGSHLHLAYADALFDDTTASQPVLASFAQNLHPSGFLISLGSEFLWPGPASTLGKHALTFEFPVPNFAARLRLWEAALRESQCPVAADVDVAGVAGKFVLTGGEIQGACREAKARVAARGTNGHRVTAVDLEMAARSQSSQGLRRLAQKVRPICAWTDLVLPPRPVQQLREVCAAAKYRAVVFGQWGFERRLSLGKGLNVLLCGTSGTGKTLAASLLAQELGLDLYKIDLSLVVSKYIGETEKQLSQIFREAKSSNAILFFDEADALFGKRSEVKDAHDRYANIEVGYLLQKMDEYEGIVILATNFRKNMDEAFTRRIHHIIEFPLPEAQYRLQIWKTLIPPDAPLAEDVNFGFLARQFELAGGNIRNAVLAAAFLAAESGGAICMAHFIRAVSGELQKLGRLPSRAEFREYYQLIQ
jgi:SpoVK/Ycf46/Vps4 family AAA+-type ATPase